VTASFSVRRKNIESSRQKSKKHWMVAIRHSLSFALKLSFRLFAQKKQ
jgi:hypothetical protein